MLLAVCEESVFDNRMTEEPSVTIWYIEVNDQEN